MSALEAFADTPSLAFDSAPAAAGARQFVNSRASVVAYINAITAVPLGAQPIVLSGQQVGTYDPLAKQEPLRKALVQAKSNADGVASVLAHLHGLAGGHIRTLDEWVLKPLTAVRDLLAPLPADGSLTPSQSQEAQTQITMAFMMVKIFMPQFTDVRDRIHYFLTQLGPDHDTLASGPTAVNDAMARVESDARAAGMPYVLNPMTAPIGNMIFNIGGQFLGHLRVLAAALTRALEGHEAMRGGISALGVLGETIVVKYASGERALTKATDPKERTIALRRMDLNTAVRSWEQFRDFILNSGF